MIVTPIYQTHDPYLHHPPMNIDAPNTPHNSSMDVGGDTHEIIVDTHMEVTYPAPLENENLKVQHAVENLPDLGMREESEDEFSIHDNEAFDPTTLDHLETLHLTPIDYDQPLWDDDRDDFCDQHTMTQSLSILFSRINWSTILRIPTLTTTNLFSIRTLMRKAWILRLRSLLCIKMLMTNV